MEQTDKSHAPRTAKTENSVSAAHSKTWKKAARCRGPRPRPARAKKRGAKQNEQAHHQKKPRPTSHGVKITRAPAENYKIWRHYRLAKRRALANVEKGRPLSRTTPPSHTGLKNAAPVKQKNTPAKKPTPHGGNKSRHQTEQAGVPPKKPQPSRTGQTEKTAPASLEWFESISRILTPIFPRGTTFVRIPAPINYYKSSLLMFSLFFVAIVVRITT